MDRNTHSRLGTAVRRALRDVEDRNQLKQAAQRLRDSEERYRRLFESAKDGVLILDAETGMVVDVNPFMTQILGFSHEQFLGKKVWELGFFRDIVANHANFVELQQKEYIRYEDMGLETSDGRRIDVEFVSNVYLVNDRKVIQCNIRDISERKRAGEALRASERKFQGLFESSRDAIMTLEPPSWRFTTGNPASVEMFGAKNEEEFTIHRPWELSPERQPDGRASAEKAKEMIETAMREGSQFFEWTHRRIGGEEFAANVLLTRVELGRKVILQATVRDITERKVAREALEESEERYKAVAESANDAIITADSAGNIVGSNRAAARVFGYTNAEMKGQPLTLLIPQRYHERHLAGVRRIQTGGESHVIGKIVELQGRRKDTSEFPLELSLASWESAQGRFVTGTIRDITEKKRLEAQFLQAQRMEVVGQLAGGIAHDFNNLLTVINGMSELVLAQVGQDDPVHADVQEIGRAGERAATLTRQLLAFSRQQFLTPRVLNLNTVVAGVEDLLRRLLGEDLDMVVVLTRGLGNVEADPGQIEQVITNLAVNARDAMPHGGRLTIETQNVTIDEHYARQHGVAMPPGPYVQLTVSDTGVGMDEATRARVFEPFFTTKLPGMGTGLGLSTVYGIVKQSHGFIWVYSEVGRGTSFKMYLPQVTEAAVIDRPKPTVVSSSGTETILLVEDHAGLSKLATRVLEPAGYTVLGAATGEDALRLLERQEASVHLLLSDVVLPGMSGRELAERFAQTHPGMKVLYMSGYTSDTVVRHGVLDAQVSFLHKPFTRAALLRKVREVLDS